MNNKKFDLNRSKRAVTVVFFTKGTVLGVWAGSIPAVSRRMQLTDGELGAALSMIGLGIMLMFLMAGAITKKLGTRTTILTGGILLATVLPLLVLTPSYTSLFVLLLIFGMSYSVIDVGMNTHGALIKAKTGKPFMSFVHAMYSCGNMSGAGLVAILPSLGLGSRKHVFIASLTMLIVAILAMRPLGHINPAVTDTIENTAKKIKLRFTPAVITVAVLTFLALFTENAMINWSAKYLTDVASASAEVGAFAYAIFSLAMTSGRLVGNPLVHKYGQNTVMIISGFLAITGLAIAISAPYATTAIVGFLLAGLGLGNTIPILYSQAAKNYPEAPSLGIGLNCTLGFIGFLIAPTVMGIISDAIGLRMTLILPLLAMAVIVVMASNRTKCRTLQENTAI